MFRGSHAALAMATLWLRDYEPMPMVFMQNIRAFPKAPRPQRRGNRARKHK